MRPAYDTLLRQQALRKGTTNEPNVMRWEKRDQTSLVHVFCRFWLLKGTELSMYLF